MYINDVFIEAANIQLFLLANQVALGIMQDD
jgi:hypothetical protein